MEGFAPGPIVPLYGVSKHAAVALTEILRLQLEARDSPIHVAALCPGPVATSIVATEQARSENAAAGSQDDWSQKAHAERSVRRLTPHEVADDVLDALEHRRPYIFPNPGSRERIAERMERVWGVFL
jgi:short-subunit dehydrogenase